MDATSPNSIPKVLMLLVSIVLTQGCSHVMQSHAPINRNAIPAHRLPDALSAPSKKNRVPIEFTRLRRPPVQEHIVGAKDILGVYVEEVLAVPNQLPAVYFPNDESKTLMQSPSVGHPVQVRTDGTILLPMIGKVDVEGLTLPQTTEKIRRLFLDQGIINERAFVNVDLTRPRSVKVIVVREDTGPASVSLLRRDTQVLAKRGSMDAIELPVFENDLLHALSETGGLPGIDGFNEVWILRGDSMGQSEQDEMLHELQTGSYPEEVDRSRFVRIPLRVCPGQELPFTAEDVILNDGDVVFIESRDEIEYFMTGGLIDGGKYPLPRDHDVDILEAIAISNTNINGPAGNSTATNFRSGPGNIVAPTRAIVLRSLASGEQIKISVDLRVAMNDANERITIMPKDLIILKYKPSELLANIALNFINVGYNIPNN